MAEKVIFPHLTGLNWPSHILQVWLRLRALGVPAQNLRFLPEVGPVAAPEVTEEEPHEDPLFAEGGRLSGEGEPSGPRHPRGPRHDPRTGRVTVSLVDPEKVYPRLKVNVRAETLTRFETDARGNEEPREEVVGRLAHFLEPMMAGMPGVDAEPEEEDDPRPARRPIARLTQQIVGRYPELLATISPDLRDVLVAVAEELGGALAEADPERRRRAVRETTASFYRNADPGGFETRLAPGVELLSARRPADLDACRGAFLALADRLPFSEADSGDRTIAGDALRRFRQWVDVVFEPTAPAREEKGERFLAGLDDDGAREQRVLFEKLLVALSYENPRKRERIVREMVEIVTTEVFTSTAVIDFLWGVEWIHGRVSDFRLNAGTPRQDSLLLSVTGGMDHRMLLLSLLRRWAEEGAFLGVGQPAGKGAPATGHDCLDLEVFDDGERAELWSLVAWRRETPSPIALMETAAHRLIHPEIHVLPKRYVNALSRYGTLFAQPGTTAVLGGKARMQYPGVEIRVPLPEDADEQAVAAKAKLRALIRIFLPVCFRVEIVWREAVARLDRATYLRHEFQQGARLADPWAALEASQEEAYDKVIQDA